jgi:hypothetical protein
LSAKISETPAFHDGSGVAAYLRLQGFVADRSESWCFRFAAPRGYSLSARAMIHSDSQE